MPDYKVNARTRPDDSPKEYTISATNREELDARLSLMWPDGKVVGVRQVPANAQQ